MTRQLAQLALGEDMEKRLAQRLLLCGYILWINSNCAAEVATDPDITVFSRIRIGSGSTCYNKTRSGSDYSDLNFQKYPCDSNFPNSKCLFLRKFRCCNRFFRSTCFGDQLTVHSSPSSCGVVNGRVDLWKMLGGGPIH